MGAFSLIPPIIRYKTLKFLYEADEKYKENVNLIDRFVLSIIKTYDKDKALEWVEANKDNLIRLSANSEYDNKSLPFIPEINMYECCKSKIMKNYPSMYKDFENAKKFYREFGIVNGNSEEIVRFNDIMQFVFIGSIGK